MRNGFIGGVVFASLVALAAARAEGQWEQSLNGPWQFATNSLSITWDTLTVPGNWDTLPAYSTHKGKGWYRREFTVPADWQGKRIRLKFDAVYHDATVALNGKELGSHNGGYTPFEFDVTDAINLGGTNTVTVCADNTYRRGAWWHWGGLSRSVTLIANHDARIVWQHIRSEPDLGAGTAKVFIRYKLANAGAKPLEVSLASAIDGVQEPALAKHVTLPARGGLEIDLKTTLAKERVRLWHFDQPNLYQLVTRLAAGGKVVHEQADRFGIRKIQLTQDALMLNGERVRLCGFNRVSDSREFGNAEPDALVKLDVDLMKRANGNLSRLMHYPQAPNLLDYLDEKGMLIWCEIPVWGSDDPQVTSPSRGLPQQWMAEMIERDYNHPCIIGWSVGNELAKHFRYVSDMTEFTKALDPHRIVTHVSNTGARSDYNRTNDPISISAITLFNTYSPSRNAAVTLHAKWPQQPLFFSEFGIKQFGGKLDASIPGLEAFYLRETAHPFVVGVSLWTFNDYRSDFPGTPASGNREWGVVDVQRRPKAAYQQLRKLFSPVHSLTVTNEVIRLKPRSADEVPSFTLRGYKLKWNGGEIALPDLKPGDPVWDSKGKVTPGAVVKLVTPTGYDVAESSP